MRIIFVCFTPYQLTCSMIYREKLAQNLTNLNTVLIWKNFSNYEIDIGKVAYQFDQIIEIPILSEKQNIILKQFKKLLYYGHLFTYTKAGRKIKKLYGSAILCIFSDQELVTNRILKIFKSEKNITVVLLDEGLHLYDEPRIINRSIIKRINNYLLGITYVPNIGATKNINTIIAKFPQNLPPEIVKDRKIVSQGSICRYSKDWSFILSSLDAIKLQSAKTKPLIIYLGQPIIAEGVSENIELKILSKVFSILSNHYTILLKPHPRDRLEKYNALISQDVQLLSNIDIAWVPAEIIADYLSPAYIMSAWSSSCSSLGIPLIYLYQLMDIPLKNSALQVNRSNVICIKDYKQLFDISPTLNQTDSARTDAIDSHEDITYLTNLVKLKLQNIK